VAGEERREDRAEGVVVVERRQAEQLPWCG
jgi:hypothetical protein